MGFFFRPQTGAFTVSNNNSFLIDNVGIATSVAASALTIDLKQLDGSTDPSAGSPATIAFRDGTLTSGAINKRQITSALSITVPSGATLNHNDNVAGYIYVYAVDNSGTISLAVSSVPVNENELQTVTAIGTGSDAKTLYGTSLSSKPVRLLARLVSTQTTAGTWAVVPTEASIITPGFQANGPIVTPWETFTPTGNWSSNITYTGVKRRVGDSLEFIAKGIVSASGSTGNFTVNLPDSLTVNTDMVIDTSLQSFGTATVNNAGSGTLFGSAVYNNTTSLTARYLKNFTGTQYLTQVSATDPFSTLANGDFVIINALVPIDEWATT